MESTISVAIDVENLACQILIFSKKRFRERVPIPSELRISGFSVKDEEMGRIYELPTSSLRGV
ncbi:MAG: hypothetical protein LBF57_01260 [Holosporaceae bacterium]|nr:hypothetical protein [Holosporaceae bacterium]